MSASFRVVSYVRAAEDAPLEEIERALAALRHKKALQPDNHYTIEDVDGNEVSEAQAAVFVRRKKEEQLRAEHWRLHPNIKTGRGSVHLPDGTQIGTFEGYGRKAHFRVRGTQYSFSASHIRLTEMDIPEGLDLFNILPRAVIVQDRGEYYVEANWTTPQWVPAQRILGRLQQRAHVKIAALTTPKALLLEPQADETGG